MSSSLPIVKGMDREFLGIRCRLIELAAMFDRLDREKSPADDPRRVKIAQALDILLADVPDRAERIQMALSLPYQQGLGIGD